MSKKIKNIFFVVVLSLFLAKSATSASLFILSENKPITGSGGAETIIELTNNYRKNLNLRELTANPRLTQAAINKARDIMAGQYFSHTSPDGKKFSAWIKEVGYDYFYIGENLAIDFNRPEEAFKAWVDSPGHRSNLERGEFQEIGVAYLSGKFQNRQTTIVVQLFGSRVLSANEINSNNTPNELTKNYFLIQSGMDWPRLIKATDTYLNFSFLLIIALLIAWQRQEKKLQPFLAEAQIETTTKTTTNQINKEPELFDNRQMAPKSANPNIAIKIWLPNNRQRQRKESRITTMANQLHRH